ncbi:MAG TPA: efflux RND transporter periplasmic adaptor subunit [Blastocatellia bacterium]|nr:efflux RND transporter periplasmic adaptor subunit [Blastocatellia bacterium]
MKNLPFGVLILVAASCCACGSDKPAASPAFEASASANGAPTKAFVLQVFEIKESRKPGDLLIPAVISVEGTAQVLAGRDGTILELGVQEGASVKKGQVLARLNDEDLRAALRQAELEVERLLVEERQYDAMIKVSRSELEQETALLRDGLTSKRQVDRAQYKLEVATQELERVRLATSVARAKVTGARIEMEKTVVRAPINGFIARRYVHLGAGVVKNDKMFEISQRGPFEVKFQLPQTEKGRLGRGSVVDLSLADNDRIVARARIRRVDPVADAASNTVGFLADVVGKTPLISGLAVNVHVPKADAQSSVWIPRSGLPSNGDLRSGAAKTLFVLNGSQCELRVVRVISVEGDQVEIGSGLSVGERVILAAPAELKAGDIVEARAN